LVTLLQATGLRKQYRMGEITVNALNGVDFSVTKGEFVAIMGPSGSGKSTLLHVLGGLDVPSGGDVMLDGRSFMRMDDDALTVTRRREIGFIFQSFNLMPTLTTAENVALPLLVDGRRLPDHAARLDELLEMVGLQDRQDHKPHQLSGGQQQRVAIARALVTQPKLVLADEPTGNLDSAASAAILALLRRARDEHSQTIVMVTHDKRAAAVADRVVFLQDGQVASELGIYDGRAKTRTQEIAAVLNDLGM
jgi:putative ABC transport system ATP-binding protein